MRNALRNHERELARKLAPEAVEPPDGLLARLKAEIPDELPALNRRGGDPRGEAGDESEGGRVLRFPALLGALSGATLVKVAATVALALGAGFLALQVRREVPDPQLQEANARIGAETEVSAARDEEVLVDAMEALAATPPANEPAAAPAPVPDPSPAAEPEGPIYLAPPPPPPSRPAPARQLAVPKPTSKTDKKAPVWVGTEAPIQFRKEAPEDVEEALAETDVVFDLPEAEVPKGRRVERFAAPASPLVDTTADSLSTFGLDVDTGSYGLLRRHLMESTLPPPETVRIEELLNAFDYGDPAPATGDFAITAQGAPSPFRPGLELLRLGIKARVVTAEHRKPAALTFVVDVSGSMQEPDRLPLAKQALGLLLDQLEPGDTVALVAYGSEAQIVLPHTADKEAVRRALDQLGDGGSTNAEAGLLLGYEEARRVFRRGAINRIVLCSDGVANVGATDPEELLERVGREARKGIELTTLGFGMGEYNDRLMEQLADKGDGRYAYLDDLIEAHRVLVEELTGTVQTIARDARVQFELNPDTVQRYRLLGYENRDIEDRRFRFDDQDAGEIGSGHAVTALYELELAPAVADTARLGVLRLRWWSVEKDRFEEIEQTVYRRDLAASWSQAAPALRWAALTARFAQVLRGQAPIAELPDLADRMYKLTAQAWAGDERRTELADLTRHAAEVSRVLHLSDAPGGPQRPEDP